MKNLLIIVFGVLVLAGCSNPFGITDQEWNALSSEQKAYYRKEFHYYKADRKMPQGYAQQPTMYRPQAPQVPYYQYYNSQPNGYAPLQPRYIEQRPFDN